MAETPGNATLQMLRITSLLQQVPIVVALQYQSVAPCQHPFHMWRCAAQVSHHPETMPAVRKNKLYGLARIMGHGKRRHFQIADEESLMTVDQYNTRGLVASSWRRCERPMCHPDRQPMTNRQFEGPGYVIAVFVGYENAGQIVRRQAETAQFEDRLPRTESAIQQEAGFSHLDEQGIATAATAQRRKAHYFNWS